jgi:energy-dependent translational throttle protein EttA
MSGARRVRFHHCRNGREPASPAPRTLSKKTLVAPQFIYVMKALRKVVPPSKVILDDIWLSFYPGAKIGVLGANGAGKSSLLRIMAGVDQDFQGEAWAAKGTKIGYLAQEPQLDPTKNVRENVEEAVADQRKLLNRFNEISAAFADPDADFDKLMAEQARVQERIDTLDLWNLDNKIEIAMDALRLPPDDADVNVLSGGEKRRVALCRILLEQPDMLLLDEPTNHLDAESVEWLEHFLADFPGTVVAITHDRYFLDNVAKWILELDRGKGMPYEGNYTSWLEQKRERLKLEEKTESARQRTLARELEWVRMAPRARQAKSKARIQKFEELQAEDTGDKVLQHEITIPPPPRLGNDVVIAKGLKKAYGEKVLFDDLTFSLPRGGIVGVIGPNGAGKTTLFRMIVGEENPDGGDLKIGETVELAYVDQGRVLDSSKTAYQEVSEGRDEITVGNREINARAYLSQFNFRGTDQQKKVGDLSGGERNRLHLAKLLKSGGNVLLLDEPTNDLDVDTLRGLEEALVDFAGCAVVISHDRWFLDRIATHILAFEGNSEVVWFEGNFKEYDADLRRRKGADADTPHRVTYKKLVRS